MKKCCLLMGAAAASLTGIASADTVATVLIDGETYEMASFMVDGEFRLVPAVYTFGDTTVEALETPRAPPAPRSRTASPSSISARRPRSRSPSAFRSPSIPAPLW
jgi:hypothetical protein